MSKEGNEKIGWNKRICHSSVEYEEKSSENMSGRQLLVRKSQQANEKARNRLFHPSDLAGVPFLYLWNCLFVALFSTHAYFNSFTVFFVVFCFMLFFYISVLSVFYSLFIFFFFRKRSFFQRHERVPATSGVHVLYVCVYICGADLEFFQLSFHTITQMPAFLPYEWWWMVVNDDALFPFYSVHFCMALYCRFTFYAVFD